MKVPFQDLARLHKSIEEELDVAVARVVSDSAFVGGGIVGAFEDEFAAEHGLEAAAACGSGTDALSLTLRALDVGPGDEVIVPSMTFVATAEAVVHTGATPVLADVEPDSLLLSAHEVERHRTTRTRAVVPVHLYGNMVPPELISRWRDNGLLVVEDSAQAHLASHSGVGVGAAGNAACFSFYPGKNLGAWGDGGAVASDDCELISRVRVLRDHGRTSKYVHELIGWCSRLDGLQAAVLAVKLRHLAEWTGKRRVLADRYRSHLGHHLVPWSEGAVHHLMVLRVEGGRQQRDMLQQHLTSSGVATGIHYPIPLSRQPAMAPWAQPTPHAEAAAESILSLPMDPLMSIDEVDHVCELVLEWMVDQSSTSGS